MPRELSYHSIPGRTLVSPERANPLSPERQRLLKLLFKLNFGRVEHLPILKGQPQLDKPGVRIIQEHKFPRDPEPRSCKLPDSFWLKPQVLELCELFDQQPNIIVMSLEVRHGLPFRLLLVQVG